jgi:hypothetical protein
MNLEAIYFISQIAAAVAIIGSLLFVGMQMRHADKTQRALMHQATIQRTIELNQRLIDPNVLALIIKARDAHAHWSVAEIWQIRSIIRVMILHVADMQWQRRAGLLDASAFDSVITITQAVLSLPGMRICWQMILPRVTAADRALVEDLLLKDVPVSTQTDLSATWQTIAAQLFPTTG